MIGWFKFILKILKPALLFDIFLISKSKFFVSILVLELVSKKSSLGSINLIESMAITSFLFVKLFTKSSMFCALIFMLFVLSKKFTDGFKDALLVAEEIYLVDISHGEPIFERLNPLKVHAIRTGNSNRFEDADIIIMEDHKSPNQLVDEYYEQKENQ